MADEKLFLRKGDIYVSSTKIVLHGTTYATAQVTSVSRQVTPAKTGCAFAMLAFGLLAAFFALTALIGGGDRGVALGLLIVGVLLTGGAVLGYRSSTPTHNLVLASASGERNALESKDEALVASVAKAISDAITYRG